MSSHRIWNATVEDVPAIAGLLYDFNTEYHEPTPSPPELADRLKELMADDTAVVLGGHGPDGLALVRFRPSLWSRANEAYLAELYVRPEHRGHGLGRALLTAAIELARARGADYFDLSTSEDDVAARKLYESCGFRNRESRDDGPIMYTYEREL